MIYPGFLSVLHLHVFDSFPFHTSNIFGFLEPISNCVNQESQRRRWKLVSPSWSTKWAWFVGQKGKLSGNNLKSYQLLFLRVTLHGSIVSPICWLPKTLKSVGTHPTSCLAMEYSWYSPCKHIHDSGMEWGRYKNCSTLFGNSKLNLLYSWHIPYKFMYLIRVECYATNYLSELGDDCFSVHSLSAAPLST